MLASGDLTDARGKDFFVSQQYEDEWKTYNEVLKAANVKNKTIWLDLRGNHGIGANMCFFLWQLSIE